MDTEVEARYRREVQQGLKINTKAVVKLDKRLPRAMSHNTHVTPKVVQLQGREMCHTDLMIQAAAVISTNDYFICFD